MMQTAHFFAHAQKCCQKALILRMRKFFLWSLMTCFLLASSQALAVKETYGPYKGSVVRVKDGDTILLDVRIWPGLTQRVSLRLDGVNTPEKRGKNVTECEKKAGQKATNFTQQFLKGVDTVVVTGIRFGKYAGRVLGQLEVPGKGDLGKALIKAGLAKSYSGGKRAPWCVN